MRKKIKRRFVNYLIPIFDVLICNWLLQIENRIKLENLQKYGLTEVEEIPNLKHF